MLRRRGERFSSASDDEVGGLQSAIRAERSEAINPGTTEKETPVSQPTTPTTQNEMEGEAPSSASLGPILVIIPTYNESENIARIISRTRESVPDAHILIADNSPTDRQAGRRHRERR